MFPSVDSQLMEMARKSMNPTERRVRRSLSARILHRMKGLKDLSNWVVAPSHWVPRLRSYFVILTCLYNATILPFRIAFTQGHSIGATCSIDYFGDLVLVADMLLCAFFIGFEEKDELILAQKRITERFIHSPIFWYHLASILPTDLFVLCGPFKNLGPLQVLSLLRLNRLGRFISLSVHSTSVEKHLRSNKYFKKFASAGFLKILKMLAMICFCVHIAGCIFFFIALQLSRLGLENWAVHYGVLRACEGRCGQQQSTSTEIITQYVYSIYWAVSFSANVSTDVGVIQSVFC
jgi:hypothetical protein